MFHLLRKVADCGIDLDWLTVFGVDFTMRNFGQVAQSVERGPEKAGVGGSIPSLATMFSSSKSRRSQSTSRSD